MYKIYILGDQCDCSSNQLNQKYNHVACFYSIFFFCCKTKQRTKTANQNKATYGKEPIRTQRKDIYAVFR